MSLSNIFGDEFDLKSWSDKIETLRQFRKGSDQATFALCVQTCTNLCNSGDDWSTRFWIVQLMSMWPRQGEESKMMLHVCRYDKSARIRSLAARYIAKNSQFYDLPSIRELLDEMNLDERRYILAAMKSNRRYSYVDGVLDYWKELEEPSYVRFAYFGTTAYVQEFLPEWRQWLDRNQWTKMAKHHPQLVVNALIAELESAVGVDSILNTIINESLQVLDLKAVSKDLLLHFLVMIEKFEDHKVPAVARITTLYTKESLECFIREDLLSSCWALPSKLNRHVTPEELAIFIVRQPRLLAHLHLQNVRPAIWVTQLWRHLTSKMDINNLVHESKWVLPILPRLPRDIRYLVVGKIDTKKMEEEDALNEVIALGPFEAAIQATENQIHKIDVRNGRYHSLFPLLSKIFLRNPEHLSALPNLIRKIRSTVEVQSGQQMSQQMLSQEILTCLCQQPWQRWTAESFPTTMLLKEYDIYLAESHWRDSSRVSAISDGETKVWNLAIESFGTYDDFSRVVLEEKIPVEAFIAKVPSLPAGVFDDMIAAKIDLYEKAFDKLKMWAYSQMIRTMLQTYNSERRKSGKVDMFPILKRILKMKVSGSEGLKMNAWVLNELTSLLLRCNRSFFEELLKDGIKMDFDWLSYATICKFIMRYRHAVLRDFFASDMKSKSTNKCVRLGASDWLFTLPSTWQLRYARALLTSIKPSNVPEIGTSNEDDSQKQAAANEVAMDDGELGDQDLDNKKADTEEEESDEDSVSESAVNENLLPAYGYNFDRGLLMSLGNLPALPWSFICENIIESDKEAQPEWLARRGIYALAHVDDSRAIEYLMENKSLLGTKDAFYAAAPAISRLPPTKALKYLSSIDSKQVSVNKQLVRTYGLLGTKASQEELFRIFRDPPTHNHVRIAIIRGLWNLFYLPNTWTFFEEVAKFPAWNVCRKLTEITNYRLGIATKDRLLQIFGLLLERNEKKLTAAVLQRLSWSSLEDHKCVLVSPCIKLMELDASQRSTIAGHLLRALHLAKDDGKSQIMPTLTRFATDWLGHFRNQTLSFPSEHLNTLLHAVFANIEKSGDILMQTRLLAACNNYNIIESQVAKNSQNEAFMLFFTQEVMIGVSQLCGIKDELSRRFLADPHPRVKFLGLLLKVQPNAHSKESVELLDEFVQQSTDPLTRSYARFHLDTKQAKPRGPIRKTCTRTVLPRTCLPSGGPCTGKMLGASKRPRPRAERVQLRPKLHFRFQGSFIDANEVEKIPNISCPVSVI
eukprot:Gregarina_sp_Poly_1__6621@NODE_355_length_9287_cov_174_942082_g296_i0_p1_GENE_NODE_355_length_9287_cov_174_942082_g296_i0NODE_355_length_9287_cov_174_942082_g296_i0_p1_ORF_typecomplete_len1253_score173_61FANCI_S1/PF14675_6/0_61FANCI_S1/PF14675_6/7_1e02Iron_traffic/PF04362_14/0_18_NODE_355_length_9287_cov_174_942082_g296_i07924550